MPKAMRVYYDCEFLEDGKTIDLISIGMVREDGKEFYAVSSEFDTVRVSRNNWLMDNVMTSIEHTQMVGFWGADLHLSDPALMTRKQIRAGIVDFVKDIWPEFWAWYGAYDHVALCQLFGKMVDLPKNFPMFTCDIKQLHKEALRRHKDTLVMPVQPEGLHNALSDAKFNVVRYNYLKGLLNEPE